MIRLISFFLLCFTFLGHPQELDLRFIGQHDLSSSRVKACGNAGIASRGDLGSGMTNPALLSNAAEISAGTHLSLHYGRDSLFNRHIIPVSITHAGVATTYNLFYRFMNGDEGVSHQTFGLSISGKLFDKVDVQGPVDAGITFRCEQTSDRRQITRPLTSAHYLISEKGNLSPTGIIDSVSTTYRTRSMLRRIVADLGFYQPDILERLDFGLVIRNLAGYEWNRFRPMISYRDSTLKDTVSGSDTLPRICRTGFVSDRDQWDKSWYGDLYRTITIGTVYRIIAGKHRMNFPTDLELYGLFDKKQKNRFVFKGGAELQLDNGITLRMGYARKPKTILEGLSTFKNSHFLSGGAGLVSGPIHFDCYFAGSEFGISTQFGL